MEEGTGEKAVGSEYKERFGEGRKGKLGVIKERERGGKGDGGVGGVGSVEIMREGGRRRPASEFTKRGNEMEAADGQT